MSGQIFNQTLYPSEQVVVCEPVSQERSRIYSRPKQVVSLNLPCAERIVRRTNRLESKEFGRQATGCTFPVVWIQRCPQGVREERESALNEHRHTEKCVQALTGIKAVAEIERSVRWSKYRG